LLAVTQARRFQVFRGQHGVPILVNHGSERSPSFSKLQALPFAQEFPQPALGQLAIPGFEGPLYLFTVALD
jgi:hypothetical protein